MGNITMVEHTQYGPQDPDFSGFGQGGSSRQRSYAFGRSAKDDFAGGESVPLFLSDPDGEPDPSEYDYPESEAPRLRMSMSLKILIAVVAAAGVAMIFAMATSDAMHDVILSAKASISGMQPMPAEAAQQEASLRQANAAKLTASDAQAKDPARWSPPNAPQAKRTAQGVPQVTPQMAPQATSQATAQGPVIAMAPTRDEISSAYQSAVQSHAPPPAPAPAAPAAAVAAPPVTAAPVTAAPAVAAPLARQIDPDELAVLMKRAKEMLGAGDIPAARLLLRRAADAQDPTAALMLAQTYDPDVLGTQDVRNINPDPEMARTWYQKAAQLGSTDAQRRLAQLQN
jgi:TPR repeat protein